MPPLHMRSSWERSRDAKTARYLGNGGLTCSKALWVSVLSVGGTEHSPCTMLWEPTVPSLPLPLVLGEWVYLCLDVPIYRIGTVLCIVFEGLGPEPRGLVLRH